MCPLCKTKEMVGGTGSPPQKFSIRGKWNGYPALKCNSCDVGLYVSHPLLHMVFGFGKKLKLIPEDDWYKMKAIWKQEFGEE